MDGWTAIDADLSIDTNRYTDKTDTAINLHLTIYFYLHVSLCRSRGRYS